MDSNGCHLRLTGPNGEILGWVVDGCPEAVGECGEVAAFWSAIRALTGRLGALAANAEPARPAPRLLLTLRLRLYA